MCVAVEVARAPVVVDVLGTVRRVVEVAAAVVLGRAVRVVEREVEVPAPLAEEDLQGVVAGVRVGEAHLDVRVALVRPQVVRVVLRPRRVRLAVREGRQVDVRPPHQVGAVGADVGDLAEEAPPRQLALQAQAPVPLARDLEARRDRLHAAPRRERGHRGAAGVGEVAVLVGRAEGERRVVRQAEVQVALGAVVVEADPAADGRLAVAAGRPREAGARHEEVLRVVDAAAVGDRDRLHGGAARVRHVGHLVVRHLAGADQAVVAVAACRARACRSC